MLSILPLPALLLSVGTAALDPGAGVVVTRLSCAPEAARDEALAPRDRMSGYHGYSEVMFGGGREQRCFPAGDYALDPLMQTLRDRMAHALGAVGVGEGAGIHWLGAWQHAPEEGVDPADVTRARLELESCLSPQTGPRWICRMRLRVWYFRPSMKREGTLLDLVVDATADTSFDASRWPFARDLDTTTLDPKRGPPLDLSAYFE